MLRLTSLSLVNFKNYEQANFNFCKKINCLTGSNGVGKTNVLDAVYLLSMTKSNLNPIDTQNIRYDADFFVVQGEYERNETTETVYCAVKRGQKKVFRRNKKDYERLSEHIGLLPAVSISPADGNLIYGRSDERRKLMNEVISQHDHEYLHDMMQYNRALEQRNAMLKQDSALNMEVLELWNEKLVTTGNKIYKRRSEYCQELIPVFQNFYNEIAGDGENVQLLYSSQLHDNDFAAMLNSSFTKDRLMQYTTTGIHKDDLLFQMNEYPLKKSASQGQQKTFLVAMKLANFDYIRKNGNIKPILLLDDIFDKFDALRVKQIIRLVAGEEFGQIFITDTGNERTERILKEIDCVYQLHNIA